MLLQPKNWAVFQHYKDRSPPWIKLHRNLLINRDFVTLPTASKALAPMLWLLASEGKDGVFDATFEELQFRLYISKKDYDDGLKPLIDKGFFVVASGVLAECYQDASPEREKETETETKKEKKTTGVVRPDGLDENIWIDFLTLRRAKKLPLTKTALKGLEEQGKILGWTIEEVITECINRNWGGFKASWIQKELLSNPADRARVTVPSKQERDPALVKLDQDRQLTKPPSLETLARMAALRRQA